MRIAYCFCDHGAEAEVLSAFGRVERFTIDPRENPVIDETTQMDLMEDMPEGEYDLAVLHPSCAPWADTTHLDGDREDHENQIPRAREIARSIATDYIIENKPRAPLRDPTLLNGKQFGLPIKYERAFETSFPVLTPPRERELPTEVSPYFYADRTHAWWSAVKGYNGEYPKEHLAKNSLPAAYVWCLARSWLKAVNERDGKQAQDNNDPAPRTVTPDQATLVEVDDV